MLPNPWGIPSLTYATSTAAKAFRGGGFVCPPSLSSFAITTLPSSPATSSTKLHSTKKKNYSAEWVDLLGESTYTSPSISLPKAIDPPRSGAVSFSTPSNDKLFTFGGYAEIAPADPEAMPERYVVNDLWTFEPYPESSSEGDSSWGWTKQNDDDDGYIPGPRLATDIAVL
ncbi:hypothetical protein ACHAXR_000054, partial [Thalassiosira sp. AJA248-18]